MAKLTRRQLSLIIAELVDNSKDEKKLARDIAQFLVQEQQTGDLDSLMRAVMAERQRTGTVEAEVTSAFDLSPAVKKDIQTTLKAQYPKSKNVVIHSTLNREVLAGVRIQTVDKQLDTTARAKLDQLTGRQI